MSADSFLQLLTQVLFVVIFAAVAVRAIVQPQRANFDAALLFGATALIIAETWVTEATGLKQTTPLRVILEALLLALPYLVLRLVDDFAGISRRVVRAAEVGLAISIVLIVVWSGPRVPGAVVLPLVIYFVVLSVYCAVAVLDAARLSSGVTRRRMRAVAAGIASLGLVIVVAGLQSVFPDDSAGFWKSIADVLSVACALGFFIGFVPPAWLRRAWQEPELRAFLGRASLLPRLPETNDIVAELERGAARSLGTREAIIGIWNETDGTLEFPSDAGNETAPSRYFPRKAFQEQRPIFSADVVRENPVDREFYRSWQVNSALAVPITAGEKKLGALAVYAARAPMFSDDDIALAQMLADQASVVLESRALIDEAARVQAREEATRLKDDFLSAAAHDLKTPLTALIAQAQLLERRMKRNPSAPADERGIQRMVEDSQRLKRLVTDLLDVGRVEQGNLLDRRESVDLMGIVQEACEQTPTRLPCHVDPGEPVIGCYDRVRIRQLVDNLIENAVKYSPDGGTVRVRVWREDDMANLTVTDSGIGIPPDDLEMVFDRFHRGTNVDDRRFVGMGLGLFICRGIVEQHGGRLWATSAGPGKGSTFHVTLPLNTAQAETPPAEGGLEDVVASLASGATA